MTIRCALLLLVAFASTAVANEDWPQFRGPDGQGHSDSVGVALTWSESEHVSWKTAIPGEGWSSPVVRGNQVWMTAATEKGLSLRAICVDRTTGQVVHDVEVFKRDVPIEKHATNSFASPTPIIENDRVWVHFGTMGTACLDAKTAKIVWQNHDLQFDHEVGPGSSPELFENLLLFNCDGTDVQYGAALDKKTGALVWKTNRSGKINDKPDRKKAFVTPLVIRSVAMAAGATDNKDLVPRDLVIMTGAEWVYAYDPRSGEEVWKVQHPGFSVVPRPIFGHGTLYVSTGYMMPELFAIRPEGRGNVTTSHVAWKIDKGVPTRPSPILVGDEIYLVSDAGVINCVDAKTGKQHYRQRVGGNFSASPIAVEGRIYCCGEDGRTIVFAPGKKYEELASNHLDGRFMASPAVAGHSLFLRTDTHLYRIDP